MKLTDYVRAMRIKKQIPQNDFAKSIGSLSTQQVCNWERGACSVPPKYFKKISKILKVDVRDIVEIYTNEVRENVWREVNGR